MKVLFAVNNDNISEAVTKKFQRDYKEILSYKNVYYFNAILRELQNNKDYDRVVIAEDLEPFANNNYDTIDKFLFEKLEKINEEAENSTGTNIEIILICADRRAKSDDMLTKLFGIGMYNALIGNERDIENLCRLMKQPRTKKEAKAVYKIEGNVGMFQADDENGVSEAEVQNILAHYKRLGKNEDKYVDSFNNIVSQYTDAQLRIIIKCLPLHVKAVLEQRSPKYQQLSTFSARNRREAAYEPRNLKTIKTDEKINVKMLENDRTQITKPIVIPSELGNQKSVKIQQKNTSKKEKIVESEPEESVLDDIQDEGLFETEQEEPKRGRGRPRKNQPQEQEEEKPKRGRGRPKKEEPKEENEDEFDIDLFNMDSEDEEEENTSEDIGFDLFNMGEEENEVEDNAETDEEDDDESEDELNLFEMPTQDEEEEEEPEGDDEDDEEDEVEEDDEDEEDLFTIADDQTDYVRQEENANIVDEDTNIMAEENHYVEPTVKSSTPLSTYLTGEKKIVSFVGTTKNGTSFVVNNLGLTLSNTGISTAILDMTQNKNSYYIFTKNEEKLRKVAESSISNLEKGIAEGIRVEKNLTVYTEIPGENKTYQNIENMLITLMEKHDVVLIDTDFNTNPQCFEMSQEIYLVQSMDVLTIQPLTAFLRNLKTKNILKQEKVKIVINKEQGLRTLTDDILIGGISSYNDPTMTLMTELFNKNNVKYCKIPFEVQNYVKYLDSLVVCEMDLRGYTKALLIGLNELAEMVYPLLNKTSYKPKKKDKRRMEFSDATRNTLNKMKKNY